MIVVATSTQRHFPGILCCFCVSLFSKLLSAPYQFSTVCSLFLDCWLESSIVLFCFEGTQNFRSQPRKGGFSRLLEKHQAHDLLVAVRLGSLTFLFSLGKDKWISELCLLSTTLKTLESPNLFKGHAFHHQFRCEVLQTKQTSHRNIKSRAEDPTILDYFSEHQPQTSSML